jgi:CDP-glucose 4,6-dehydratase
VATMTKIALIEDFAEKRVLVTGHTGFKGSWLSLWLEMLGAKVFGYALPPETVPSNYEVLGLSRFIKEKMSDIRDYESILQCVKRSLPEIVFHLAAQPLVKRSYAEPRLTFETNVGGCVNLLEAIREVGCTRVVIIVTTDKVYENREWDWGYRESDRLGGHDPYSGSKVCAEIAALSYYRSFFERGEKTLLATVRAGNVIGGGDWAEDRIVPDCARALSTGGKIALRSPAAVRPWQHVFDPLLGYLVLAAGLLKGRKDLAGSWNFGPSLEQCVSVGRLVDEVISTWGNGSWQTASGGNQVHETKELRLSSEKARRQLGWEPAFDLRESIRKTVAWYRRFYDGGSDMLSFSRGQIREYMSLSVGGRETQPSQERSF